MAITQLIISLNSVDTFPEAINGLFYSFSFSAITNRWREVWQDQEEERKTSFFIKSSLKDDMFFQGH